MSVRLYANLEHCKSEKVNQQPMTDKYYFLIPTSTENNLTFYVTLKQQTGR